MNPICTFAKDLQFHWASVCDLEIEKMVNDSRTARKGKGDEPSDSKTKKQQRDGKNDSPGGAAASNSASGSGESSGLRRSTRGSPSKKQNDNASPVSVRKSLRLENRTAPPTPSVTNIPEKPSPLRRSGRENKFQSPSSTTSEKCSASKIGVKQQNCSKSLASKEKIIDKTRKETFEDPNEVAHQGKQSPKVGTKRKKRLTARRYKDMFKPIKKKVKVSDSSEKRQESGDEDGKDRESDSDKGGQQDCSDGKELKEEELQKDCAKNADDNTGGSYSYSKKGKGSDSEARDMLQPCSTADVPISSPATEAKNNSMEDMEVDDPKMERFDSQQGKLTLKMPSTESEDVVPSISSSCKMTSLAEQCPKCFRKQRLEYNALKQELCCCLSNSVDNVRMVSVSKDRGEYGTLLDTQCADKHGQTIRRGEPPLDGDRRTCFACKSAGMLLHCVGKGCTRSYHASCLPTPEENVLLPLWYCCECTKKRLTLGVHSLSEGIESVWDVREVESSNSTGVKKQKQYFVKYKGLAHIHNHWVPEIRLRNLVPELLAKFDEKKHGMHWKPEWLMPHRLLKKRILNADASDKLSDLVAGIVSNGRHEWLVKWCGLDYDQATWEFEDSSCFKTSDVQRLIREYEARHERAKIPISRGNEIQERRKGSHVKLGRISGGGGFGADSCYMNSVNKLREYYHKKHNAVLIDEQDRIVKVVYLVSSIIVNLSRPILVISPCSFLSFWEAEFLRLAASINVVVYVGNRDARNIIRSLEFYEGGNLMLQVLLSSAEVVSEDLNEIKGIQWEAVIVDDCQQSLVMAHCGSIKNLVTDWRLLLVNAQLKDDVGDYINILSLLESGDDCNQDSGPMVNSSVKINMLKERLSQFIISARFLEYWVPVQISNLQLEQYCSLILSNQTALLSSSKSDPVGSLHDILISTRKCCDHPYVVDPSLQTSLISDLTTPTLAAVLDLGTRASGKLTLLDEVLSESRNQGLKVLILFQSIGGSGRDSKGDILDDFLSIRFGSDSYERVDSGCISSRKLTALNKFNKEKERSFFLLETRACLPSIKLSSVDAVIIFDSDWNPLNDLRALQRITIDSKLEQIKVFRLYCSCTVEEKVLILAKNDIILDTNLQGISPSTSHTLLMWGSSYLFAKLDDFHRDKVGDCKDCIVPEYSSMKNVCEEIVSVVRTKETVKSTKFISVARQNGGGYLKNVALIGEQKIQLEDGVPSQIFWMKLLQGKQPQWRYLSGSSQRSRKRVHYHEFGDQGDGSPQKSRKMEKTKMDSSCQQTAKKMEKSNSGKKGFQDNIGCVPDNLEAIADTNFSSHNMSGTTCINADIPGVPQVNCIDADNRKNLNNEQWELFQLLRPVISRLCEILQLKDDVKRLAEQFLGYILKNHRVMAEPEAILQAFQISVCWTAAEALNHKIDHRMSLDVASKNMNFNCREEEAEAIYSRTKMFMKIFLRRSEIFKFSNSFDDSLLPTNGVTGRSKEHGTELEGSLGLDGVGKQSLSPMQTTDNKNDILRHAERVKKKCDKHMERLKDKHNEELVKFEKECEEKRAELEKKYKMESAIICSIHGKSSVGVEKLKIMDKNCAKEREDLELQISNHFKELEARQQTERDEEQKKTANWLEQVKSLVQNELLDDSPSKNDELRISHQNDASINSPKDMPPSIPENVPDRCSQKGPQEKPHATLMREMEQNNNLMEPCEVLSSTVFESNQHNEASTSLSTEPLPSPDIPVAKQATADPAVEASSVTRGISDESCRGMADGADHQAHQVTGIPNVSGALCLDPMPCNFSPNARVDGLPAAESSPPESVIAPSHAVDQTRVATGSRLDSLSGEIPSSDQGTVSPIQREGCVTNSGETTSRHVPILAVDHAVNSNLGQFETHASTRRGTFPSLASRLNPQVPIFARSRSSDPLQNELERIHKEIDEVISINEETKVQLISERDKEIEEMVAQIRKKYEDKLKEADMSFLLKRKELEMNQKKVMMHKILAEAFRSKCMDYRAASGMHQVSSGSIETVSQMHPATVTSSNCGSFSAIRPTVGPHSAAPTARAIQSSSPIVSSPTTRPPPIHPLLPTSGLQVRSSVCAPAPHLLCLRSASVPVTTSHTTSVSCGVSVQQPPLTKSFSAPQFPRRPPSQSPARPLPALQNSHDQSQQIRTGGSTSLPLSLSATELLMENGMQNSHDQSQQTRNGGITAAVLSLPTTELLMENEMQNETDFCHPGSSSSPLPNNVHVTGSHVTAPFETTTNLQIPSTSLGAGNDVVCLSDDE